MNSKTLVRCLIVGAVAVLAVGIWVVLQFYAAAHQQLSVKPDRFYSDTKLKPVESNIGLQARLPFQTLISAAESATAEKQTGSGERKTCKRILGAKACATLQWQYKIGREGNVQVSEVNDRLQLTLPVSFSGKVSIDGKGAKLLGLRNKKIDGKLRLIADLDVTIGSDWCPAIDSQVSYEWISDPRIKIIGDIRINLKKSADKALKRKLSELQTKLAQLVDCEQLRQDINEQWHVHTLKVAIDENNDNWLHVTPLSAAASDVAVDTDHIRWSFDLGATVELLSENASPSGTALLPLPDLVPYVESPGKVEFGLLVELPYQQLTETIAEKLVGETFGDKNSVSIESLDIYPSGELLTIDIGFSARAAGTLFTSSGNVYISARPIADPANNTLQLAELKLTRSLDSRLMSALTTVFRNQLLAALEKESLIDLSQALGKLENSIADTLADPSKTAGIEVTADSPDVRLIALNPQADGLAAIVHLSTRLDASIPEGVLVR